MSRRTEKPPVTTHRATTIGILFAAVVLVWFVFSYSASMVLAKTRPEQAIGWWPTATAQGAAAASIVAKNPSPQQAAYAGLLSRAALRQMPLNVLAVRAQALALVHRGDLVAGRIWIAHAETLSRRDVPTQLWLIEDSVGRNDIASALRHYDRAMRTSVEIRSLLLPVMVDASEDVEIAQLVGKLLVDRPDWWSDYLGRVTNSGQSPLALGALGMTMRLDPASDIERTRLTALMARIIEQGDPVTAKRVFDQANERQKTGVALVQNGAFETSSGLQPFDWVLTDEIDRRAVREPRQDAAGNALSIQGGAAAEVARQLLVLEPGRYRFQASTGGWSDSGPTPIAGIRCSGGDQRSIVEVPFSQTSTKARISVDFVVPLQGCAGQWLSFTSGATMEMVTDWPWVDDVSIQSR